MKWQEVKTGSPLVESAYEGLTNCYRGYEPEALFNEAINGQAIITSIGPEASYEFRLVVEAREIGPLICSHCNGSCEGLHESTLCLNCKGSGSE